MNRIVSSAFALAMVLLSSAAHADLVRIKDLGKIAGWRDNALIGYGLVAGLAGTGDSSRNKATRQTIANMLSRFDVAIASDDVQSRNVAAVMVSATLPPFARAGETIDVTITSIGDARSLVGGLLVLAPLKGPDDRVYALAQGPVAVGGYKYDLNGNVVQKNHPTAASIPNGAVIEVGVGPAAIDQVVMFILSDPDYTTASRIALAINSALASPIAEAKDASGIEIHVPEAKRTHLADFMTSIESLQVEPDNRAKVVVNERTGTVVTGGSVRISKVAISHGELKLSITTDNSVSQPLLVRQVSPGVRTLPYSNSRVAVEENAETGFVAADNNTVADLVQALAKLKTNTRDIISILRAVKAAGALRAELIVQ